MEGRTLGWAHLRLGENVKKRGKSGRSGVVVESLEVRRLFSQTTAYYLDWTSQDGVYTAAGIAADHDYTSGGQIFVVTDGENPWGTSSASSLTVTLSNLPAHTMIRAASSMLFQPDSQGNDEDHLEIEFAGANGGYVSADNSISSFGDPVHNWKQHSGSTVTFTVSVGDTEWGDAVQFESIGIYLYNPTVSVSGGGATSENATTATSFVISRDVPYTSNTFGHEAIPDTTVNIGLTGTATSGSDYTAPTGSTIKLENGAASATFSVTPIDDSVAEAATGVSGATESVILTLAAGTGYELTTTASQLSATTTIADDAAWYYDSGWEVAGDPIHYADKYLNTYTYENSLGGYTEIYTQKFEWAKIGDFYLTSNAYGTGASGSINVTFSASHTWGYNVSGSFDLASFIKVPVSVSGSFSESWNTTAGTGTTYTISQPGEADTRFQVAGYALFSYVVTERTEFSYEYVYNGPNEPIKNTVWGTPTLSLHMLGNTGEVSTGYVRKTKRYWLDPESTTATGKATTAPEAPTPPVKFGQ